MKAVTLKATQAPFEIRDTFFFCITECLLLENVLSSWQCVCVGVCTGISAAYSSVLAEFTAFCSDGGAFYRTKYILYYFLN